MINFTSRVSLQFKNQYYLVILRSWMQLSETMKLPISLAPQQFACRWTAGHFSTAICSRVCQQRVLKGHCQRTDPNAWFQKRDMGVQGRPQTYIPPSNFSGTQWTASFSAALSYDTVVTSPTLGSKHPARKCKSPLWRTNPYFSFLAHSLGLRD